MGTPQGAVAKRTGMCGAMQGERCGAAARDVVCEVRSGGASARRGVGSNGDRLRRRRDARQGGQDQWRPRAMGGDAEGDALEAASARHLPSTAQSRSGRPCSLRRRRPCLDRNRRPGSASEALRRPRSANSCVRLHPARTSWARRPFPVVVLYPAASWGPGCSSCRMRYSFSTSRADDSLLALERVEVATDRVEDRLIGTAVGETKLSHEVRPPPANRRYISPAEAARELGPSTSSVSISRPPLLLYRARVRPRG